MRTFLIFVFISLTLSLAIQGKEEILTYDVSIEVQHKGLLDITEKITVRAEGREINRGIYRDIPHIVRNRWGTKQELPLQVLSILRNGQPEPYHTEKQAGGTRIFIGNPDESLIPGEHTYTILYQTSGWMISLEEADELYWNVTGHEWSFPILSSTCRVTFPSGVGCQEAGAYTGPSGSKEQNYEVRTEGALVEFKTTQPLSAYEGWTITTQVPAGSLSLPASPLPFLFLVNVVSLLITIFWFVFAWWKVGIDPKRGVVIPRFTIPRGLSAAAVRYIYKMGYDNDCFTAGVVGSAQKGALKIKSDQKGYTLIQAKPISNQLLTPDEKALCESLFLRDERLELTSENHHSISEARKGHEEVLRQNHLGSDFVNNFKWWIVGLILSGATLLISLITFGHPVSIFMYVWLTGWTFGSFFLVSQWIKGFLKRQFIRSLPVFLFSLPFIGGWFLGISILLKTSDPFLLIIFVTVIALSAVFFQLIKAPTKAGREILDQIEGLKLYLSVAEVDRLNFSEAPPLTPEHYEEFLPYAVALNVGENWTQSFADHLELSGQNNQSNYRSSFHTGSVLESRNLVSGAFLGGALGAALSSSAKAPSSSGGSGGSGSSGGGGGGGGGGGW